jgi:predicted transcriptional regulator
MVKTTVYLEEDQATALRRLAAHTGRSQAEIIRAAVADATAETQPRRFRSHGAGEGSGHPVAGREREILRKEFPRRR